MANNSVHLSCLDDTGKHFALNFVVPTNRWTASFPSGTQPIFKVTSGVWGRAVNITTMFKDDASTRVGHLNPFNPETASVDDPGDGKAEDTASTFTWKVDLVT